MNDEDSLNFLLSDDPGEPKAYQGHAFPFYVRAKKRTIMRGHIVIQRNEILKVKDVDVEVSRHIDENGERIFVQRTRFVVDNGLATASLIETADFDILPGYKPPKKAKTASQVLEAAPAYANNPLYGSF